MKKHLLPAFAALTGLLAIAGCGTSTGAGAGDPSDPANLDGDAAPMTISFQATDGSAIALTADDAGGSAFDITAASMVVERIDVKLPDGVVCSDVIFDLPDFASCDDDEDEDKIRLTGPFTFDLLTGESDPPIDTISFPSGVVREVKIRVERLTASGSADLDGTATPFSMNVELGEDIEFEDLTGFEISEAVSVNALLLSFNVGDWLNGVDLGACVDDGEVEISDGTIVIDEDSGSGDCSDIENVIKDNVEASGTIEEEDHDDDDDDDSGDDSDDDSDDDEDDD